MYINIFLNKLKIGENKIYQQHERTRKKNQNKTSMAKAMPPPKIRKAYVIQR